MYALVAMCVRYHCSEQKKVQNAGAGAGQGTRQHLHLLLLQNVNLRPMTAVSVKTGWVGGSKRWHFRPRNELDGSMQPLFSSSNFCTRQKVYFACHKSVLSKYHKLLAPTAKTSTHRSPQRQTHRTSHTRKMPPSGHPRESSEICRRYVTLPGASYHTRNLYSRRALADVVMYHRTRPRRSREFRKADLDPHHSPHYIYSRALLHRDPPFASTFWSPKEGRLKKRKENRYKLLRLSFDNHAHACTCQARAHGRTYVTSSRTRML